MTIYKFALNLSCEVDKVFLVFICMQTMYQNEVCKMGSDKRYESKIVMRQRRNSFCFSYGSQQLRINLVGLVLCNDYNNNFGEVGGSSIDSAECRGN